MATTKTTKTTASKKVAKKTVSKRVAVKKAVKKVAAAKSAETKRAIAAKQALPAKPTTKDIDPVVTRKSKTKQAVRASFELDPKDLAANRAFVKKLHDVTGGKRVTVFIDLVPETENPVEVINEILGKHKAHAAVSRRRVIVG